MTRKDFQLIADVLNNYHTGDEKQKAVVREMALTFSVRLQATNPRFKPERFVAACTQQSGVCEPYCRCVRFGACAK